MAAVVDICVRLDGLPLAIELAASSMRVFTPETLARRLQQDLTALPAGPRDTPARQRTLRRTIQWSYSLLEEPERSLFARLSIFQGGGTLEAVEQFCLPDLVNGSVKTLTALVDKSLVQARHGHAGGPRFHMLEILREFARTKLEGSGELDRLHQRYADYFAGLAERAEEEIRGVGHETWFARLRAEVENLRVALAWSLEGAHPEYGFRLVTALQYFWYYDGYSVEGGNWAVLALERSADAEPRLRAGVLRTAGYLPPRFDDLAESKRLLRQAMEIYRELGDRRNEAWCMASLGGNHVEDEADYERGFDLVRESLSIFQELDDLPGIAYASNVLGELARLRGDFTAAEEYYQASLKAAKVTGETLRIPMQYGNLSYLACRRGDFGEAVDLVRRALRLFHEMGSDYGVITNLGVLAGPLAAVGQPELAARLLAASETILGEMGARRQVSDVPQVAFYTDQIREQLGEAHFQNEWAAGAKLSLRQAVDLAFGRTAGE